MKDNELIALLITQLAAGRASVGISTVPIKQAYQPTQQGVPVETCAFINIVGHKRYGFRGSQDFYDPDLEKEFHVETQLYETTFQLSALATQNPTQPNLPTASDIVNAFSAVVQSESFIQNMGAQDVGVLRVETIRNPYFVDDRGRFEASPSFDFVLTHKQVVQTEIPVLESYTFNMYSI